LVDRAASAPRALSDVEIGEAVAIALEATTRRLHKDYDRQISALQCRIEALESDRTKVLDLPSCHCAVMSLDRERGRSFELGYRTAKTQTEGELHKLRDKIALDAEALRNSKRQNARSRAF
jgi:hypothetical protein